jgi:hypothetical protein
MRWTVAFSALVVLASCTAKGPREDQQAEQAKVELPPVGARVLIRETRGLATEPKHDAARVSGRREQLRVAEVVGYVGEFIELRSITSAPLEACTAGGIDPSVELHFFALPEELALVLGKPKRLDFDDGTKLEFAPGVPIVGVGSEASLRVGSADFFGVPLADDEIATWFRATPIERSPARISWPSSRPLYYGDHAITGTWNPPFLSAQSKQAVPGGTLLGFANACGRFTLRTDAVLQDSNSGLYAMKGPKEAIPQISRKFDPDMAARDRELALQQASDVHIASPYGSEFAIGGDDDDVWGGLIGCDPSPVWTASPKTTLLWQETGTPAGVVVQELSLRRDAIEQDGKVCFVATGVSLCIRTSQLQRKAQECEDKGFTASDFASQPDFGRRGPVPQVRQAKAQVSTGLDRDIVRRIVRAHINEIRSCYNAGLRENPKLAGRISIAFEIGSNGKVNSSAVEATIEPADEGVGECFAKAVKRWTFPKPREGATVSVVYPFELEPG